MIFLKSSPIQVSWWLANARHFIAAVSRILRVALNDFKPNSNLRWRENVIKLAFVLFWSGTTHIFSQELFGATCSTHQIPSLVLERPLLPLSLDIPEFFNSVHSWFGKAKISPSYKWKWRFWPYFVHNSLFLIISPTTQILSQWLIFWQR